MIQALTKESHAIVKKVFGRFGPKAACKRATGLSNDALENLVSKGRGKAENIKLVSDFIKKPLEVDEYSIKVE